MTKAELIAAVAAKTDLSKKDSTLAVDALFDAVKDTLKKGEKVQLAGFGTFEVRHRDARTGRNPRTKEVITIAASNVPAFKAAKALKDVVA